jgi:serine/threonine protein kinase
VTCIGFAPMTFTLNAHVKPALPGRCAANYELLMPLGTGGFATVWRARHRHLGRTVALKVLHPDERGDGEVMVKRMAREARVTASLRHPHIVTVLDHDVEHGTAWIAYEDLGGTTLLDRLRYERRLSVEDTLAMGRQVAHALEETHKNGVLHRDVKADNVLECEPGVYKLVDFGLARTDLDPVHLTADKIVVGTPAYIPPELLHGAEVTPAADQYALGILLYLCLTGRIPHHEPHDVARTIANRAALPIEAPSTLEPSIPARVDALVMRMLSSNPEERYPSMREVRLAMDMILRKLAGLRSGDQPAEPPPVAPPAPVTPRTFAAAPTTPVPSRPRSRTPRPDALPRRAASSATRSPMPAFASVIASFAAGAALAVVIGVASMCSSYLEAAEPRVVPARVVAVNLTDGPVSGAAD